MYVFQDIWVGRSCPVVFQPEWGCALHNWLWFWKPPETRAHHLEKWHQTANAKMRMASSYSGTPQGGTPKGHHVCRREVSVSHFGGHISVAMCTWALRLRHQSSLLLYSLYNRWEKLMKGHLITLNYSPVIKIKQQWQKMTCKAFTWQFQFSTV